MFGELFFLVRFCLLIPLFWRVLVPVLVGSGILTLSSAFRLTLGTAGVSVGRRPFSALVAAAGGLAGKAIFCSLAGRESIHLIIHALEQAASARPDKPIFDELEISALTCQRAHKSGSCLHVLGAR